MTEVTMTLGKNNLLKLLETGHFEVGDEHATDFYKLTLLGDSAICDRRWSFDDCDMNDDEGTSRAVVARDSIETFIDAALRDGKASILLPSVNSFSCRERTSSSGYVETDLKDYEGQAQLELDIHGERPRFRFVPTLETSYPPRLCKGRDYL